MNNLPKDIEAHSVDHLPIIKAYADKIGLVETINQLIPSEMEVDPGTYFLGLILDTLSGRNPIYRLEEFFENQDRELLLGEELRSKSFNDQNVGRVMDKAYEAGTNKIFSEVARRACSVFDVDCKHGHFDTTSVSVWGDYDVCQEENNGSILNITYGHSKDHRPDLKQFLISMLCVDRGIPILGKTEDGNASDKNVNNEVLTNISKHMAAYGLEEGAFTYIADSAMITEKNLEELEGKPFISRLPATYNECGRVIKEAVEKEEWEDLGVIAHTKPTVKRPATHYKAYESEVTLYEKNYRAVVLHSSSNDKRRQKRIDRELKTERKSLEKLSADRAKVEHFCQSDAEASAERLLKNSSKYYELEVEVEERPKYGKGRPRKDGSREVKEMHYGLSCSTKEKEEAIATFQKEAGCFVLITGEIAKEEKDAKEVLKGYKGQDSVEQNFGFLKDPAIVNAIFLKKPERIEVLGLILLLSLLIWRLVERSMRQHVEETGEKLTGWANRPTDRPTTFMMTTKFRGIIVIKEGKERRLSKPLSPVQKEYLVALGVNPGVFVDPRAG